MVNDKIHEIVSLFADEAKSIYGNKLQEVILYGSCARGDNDSDSDIDILLLLSVPPQEIGTERNKIFDIADKIDLKYDVVLAPVFQSLEIYNIYAGLCVLSKYRQGGCEDCLSIHSSKRIIRNIVLNGRKVI